MSLVDLKGRLSHGWDMSMVSDNEAISDNTLKNQIDQRFGFKFGDAAGQVNVYYSVSALLSPSSTTDYNLEDGSLADDFGASVVLDTVKALRVRHKNGSLASSINVAGDFITSNLGASASIPLVPGAGFSYVDPATGLAVTASTGDVLSIINNDGSEQCDIVIDILGTYSE